MIGVVCGGGFSSRSLMCLECVWPRAFLPFHTLRRFYVLLRLIADSFNSLGLLEKLEIRHKSSQNAYVSRLRKIKPA